MPQNPCSRKSEIAVHTSSIRKSSPKLYVQHLPRSTFAVSISKSQEINSNLPSLLLSVLHLTGLVQKLNKGLELRNAWLVFYVLLLFKNLDMLIISIVNFNGGISFKTNLLVTITLFSNFMMWHSIRHRKNDLTSVLRMIDPLHPFIYRKRTNIMVLIIFTFPIMYSFATILVCDRTSTSILYAYGYELKSVSAQIIVICIKTFLQFLIHSTFPFLIAILFCNLCLSCASCFNCLTRKILQYSPEEFGLSEQIEILKQKAKLDDILDNIQIIFSLSSFLLITSNILSCCTVLGINLNGINRRLTSVLFYGIPNLVSLIAVLWTAGGLPVEQHELKEAFYKKVHLRFLMLRCSEELQFKRELLEKPDFVLNGCNIFFYTRSSILTAVGTLLTYTLLVYER
ncbi:uncharacterized protein NPIL_511381 [Nephila pilipes]|uniref:Gustatory receptor n=1 Tax=Nephila pilipes TaxID=299642 RepID=A0A8X6TZ77_NEPPI|nr:uncharacterized protein NPIL_511381 [Nephila pilipes]